MPLYSPRWLFRIVSKAVYPGVSADFATSAGKAEK